MNTKTKGKVKIKKEKRIKKEHKPKTIASIVKQLERLDRKYEVTIRILVD
jgi:hypothetical protein